jgi:hypothetical protein
MDTKIDDVERNLSEGISNVQGNLSSGIDDLRRTVRIWGN